MAFLRDFLGKDELKEIWKTISQRLRVRGMKLVDKSEWEKHGPHSGMEYTVFCGRAKVKGQKRETWVAIYPNRVYETNDWRNISTDQLIHISTRGKRPPGWHGERPRVKRISRDGSPGEPSKA